MAVAPQTRIKLRIAGQNPLGGRQPGEIFTVAADADGVPLERFWRDRLDETARRIAVGREPAVVVVVKAAPAAETPPAAEPTPPKTKTKG